MAVNNGGYALRHEKSHLGVRIFAFLFPSHFFVSSQIYIGMTPVGEVIHRLALLARWGKISLFTIIFVEDLQFPTRQKR
jgi:hypothetical protein